MDETKKILSIKPLLKPSTCKYQVGLSTTGMPICCPRKATIIVCCGEHVNDKPMCFEHAKQTGEKKVN